jgi:hypothetical protein
LYKGVKFTEIFTNYPSFCNIVNYKPLPSFASEKYPGELKHYPTWETATKITIVAIVDIVAIVGNILIIVIVLHSKKMRTATNYYIMNLSFADLLVACFPIWIHIVRQTSFYEQLACRRRFNFASSILFCSYNLCIIGRDKIVSGRIISAMG